VEKFDYFNSCHSELDSESKIVVVFFDYIFLYK
jgi:hypothetical protein